MFDNKDKNNISEREILIVVIGVITRFTTTKLIKNYKITRFTTTKLIKNYKITKINIIKSIKLIITKFITKVNII